MVKDKLGERFKAWQTEEEFREKEQKQIKRENKGTLLD